MMKYIAIVALFAQATHGWVNDCSNIVELTERDFAGGNVNANGETDFTFETNSTTYASINECRDAVLGDPRFSDKYIIGFTCTFNTVDYDLKMLYAASDSPVFDNSTGDSGATSFMCNQVCTSTDACANSGECSADLKYCTCDFPYHDSTCGSSKDCTC